MMPQNHIFGVGLGLRRQFIKEVSENIPEEIDWFEISPENYIDRGGLAFECFEKIAEKKPIIAHGLSLSIGSLDELRWDYLKKLKTFLRQYKIAWFSDHLCFSSFNAHEFHDLLPLPFTKEAVEHVAKRARIVQDFLEVPFALENVSFYMHPEPPEMSEKDFILEVLEKANIQLMLDVNNVFVNGFNHGTDAKDFLASIPEEKIIQIHIAGHYQEGEELIIDTHGEAIRKSVWDLLNWLGQKIKLPPVLIERDNNIPPLTELLKEIRQAKEIHARSNHH